MPNQIRDKQEFLDWLKEKGIEYPNLGINSPIGNAWGVAGELSMLRRKFLEEKENNAKSSS